MPSTFFLNMVLILTDGSNMAIVDIGISEHIIGDGACLKLWDWKSWQLHYGVNMEIDEEIAALAFHPELLARICSRSHLKCGYQLAQRRRIGRAEDVTQYLQRQNQCCRQYFPLMEPISQLRLQNWFMLCRPSYPGSDQSACKFHASSVY